MTGRSLLLLASAMALLGAGGCGLRPEGGTFHITVPAGWRKLRAEETPLVPGKPLLAHEVPASPAPGSLIVFRSGYMPSTTAEQLLVQTRFLLENLPTLEFRSGVVTEAGGSPAVRVEVVQEGTGAALSPTGLGKPIPPAGKAQLPTRRVWIRIPRSAAEGTLEVFFHAPETEYARLAPEWEEVLRSLKL